ncbi:MAG: hypothetical protein ABI675_21475 [Chitinophagaceae bacterium]
MLITTEWSSPKTIQYGKNIRIRFSKGNFEVKVHSATGQSIGRYIPDDRKEFIISAQEIREILHPQISFKSTAGELHVDFELF